MNFTPEQIASTNKAGIEAILGLAHTQFFAFERLSALYSMHQGAFEEGVGHAKALLNAKDPQEYLNLNAAATQPTMEKAIAYSRSVYEVAAQTNGELAKFLEAQAVEFNKNLVALLDKVSKNAPAGSDVAVAAVKSALAAANTAYESFNKVAKQATRSPKRISPRRLHPPRNQETARRSLSYRLRAHGPLLLLSVGALKPCVSQAFVFRGQTTFFVKPAKGKTWSVPGYYFSKAFLPTCRRAQPPSFICSIAGVTSSGAPRTPSSM